MARTWSLDEADLPEELYPLRDIFLTKRIKKPGKPIELPKTMNKNDWKPNESLHDYLTRKKIPCFCRPCQAERKVKSQANNKTIV